MTQLTGFSFVVLDFLDGEKKKKRGAAEGSVGHAACAPWVQPARDPCPLIHMRLAFCSAGAAAIANLGRTTGGGTVEC